MNHATNIPLAYPEITDDDIASVVRALKSGRLSLGPAVEEFEQSLCEATQHRYAVALANGTCALHLIVRGLGLGKGDAAITTPYSFVASSNCLLFEEVKPIFVDIDPLSYNLDPKQIAGAITPNTRAVLAVDVFGRLADWPAIKKAAAGRDIRLIEDSCEALGTPGIGQFADAGCFGFYPNKQITCGEGGAIITQDEKLANFARSARNQGRAVGSTEMIHERLGYNYRLSDIASALLTSQLKRLESLKQRRRQVAQWYNDRLKNTTLRLPMAWQSDGVCWFVYIVELPKTIPNGAKGRIIETLRGRGIGAGAYFTPIHLQPYYRERFGFRGGEFPVTEYLGERTIALPFHPLLQEGEVDRVCQELTQVLGELRIG